MALTDHDTLAGLELAKKAADEHNVELIAGLELSCQWRGMGIHIVGLNIDPKAEPIVNGTQQQADARELRSVKISQKLTKLGFEGTYEGARELAGDGVVGRPHFARFLKDRGYVKSEAEAFKRYLGAGKPGDVKQHWPEIETAVSWITQSGGQAVLAHPDKYNMTRTKLRCLIELFKESGGEAIEVVSGQQTPQVTRDMADLATRFDMLSSCGSDFHVPNQPWQELGSFSQLPDQCRPIWQVW